jgi:hypothetical protein
MAKDWGFGKIKKITVANQKVRNLMNSPEMLRDLERRAKAVAAQADAYTPGAKHNVYVETGRRRGRAAVVTGNREARVAEWKHGTLTHAINAGRRD